MEFLKSDDVSPDNVRGVVAMSLDLVWRLMQLGWPFEDAKNYVDGAWSLSEDSHLAVCEAIIEVSNDRVLKSGNSGK